MDRYDFYYRQKVTEQELDDAFDAVERAIDNFVAAFDYIGLAIGGDVVENAPQNFTVNVQGPMVCYDQTSQRIAFSATQNVNMAIDENSVATAVAGGGNEKWLSLFAEFDRTLTDPRTDGFGDPIFFNQAESFKLNVVQGVEAATGTATRPPLRPDQILLGDVLIVFAQTTITNGDIDLTRTEVVFDITGTPLAIRTKSLPDALQAMVDAINGFLSGTNVWSGDNTFTGEVTLDRADLNEPRLNSTLPLGATSDYVLIWESPAGGAGILARIYTRNRGLAFTLNARHVNSSQLWVPDVAGNDAAIYLLLDSGTTAGYYNASPSGGGDSFSAYSEVYTITPGATTLRGDYITKAFGATPVTVTAEASILRAQPDDDGGPEWEFVKASNGWESRALSGILRVPLPPIPDGPSNVSVSVLWKPGAARAGGDRMSIEVFEVGANHGTPAVPTPVSRGAAVFDNSGTAVDSINTGTLSVLTGQSPSYLYAEIKAGGTAGTDIVYSVRVTYDTATIAPHVPAID